MAASGSTIDGFCAGSSSSTAMGSGGVMRRGSMARRRRFIIAGSGGATKASSSARSEEHTSELQSLMRISYAVFCLKKKKSTNNNKIHRQHNTIPRENTNTQKNHTPKDNMKMQT